jgi:peptide chain release factor 1
VHNLPAIMDGSIHDLIEKLRIADNADRLKEGQTL